MKQILTELKRNRQMTTISVDSLFLYQSLVEHVDGKSVRLLTTEQHYQLHLSDNYRSRHQTTAIDDTFC